MKTVTLTVKLTLADGVDVEEVLNEMDYEFVHGTDIVDTEIVDFSEEEE